MQLHQLEYFLAVVDAGGFTRGAERLHVVQSAVSAGIRALESELGCALFERSHHAIALTAEGEALLPHARDALSAVAGARDAVAGARGAIVGTVTVGIMAYVGNLVVASLLENFHARYPGVVVRLRQTAAGSRTNLEDVRSGILDLALVSSARAAGSGLAFDQVFSEPIVFVCWPAHPLASVSAVAVADIAGETFVDFPEGWGIRAAIDRLFDAGGVARVSNTEVTNFELALALVRRRLGVTILPASGAPTDGSVVVVPLVDAPQWAVYLARPAGRRTSTASTMLADAILAARVQ
jgi:DNA-binding transcriptional LysR family regulator